jgi:glycine C-acetyltransferase
MFVEVRDALRSTLEEIREEGLEKPERVLSSPQNAHIEVGGRDVINMCANNYLGLADHPALIGAAKAALDTWGFGLASVRFICGTQELHKELERRIAAFVGAEDAILYSSCFDANGGVFEVLLDEEDAVISDALNHASIIDGIRLCKARRLRYANRDLEDLERQLQDAAQARRKLIVTDGVFSMDGYLAPLDEICALAEQYGAMVMVDDSHAAGFVGPRGRGTPEHFGVTERVDIVTGTLGKALGGASGGFVAAHREIVELLRQRSRPYLFSNSVAPAIAAAGVAVFDLLEGADEQRTRLRENTSYFRRELEAAGFDILPGEHPIVPLMTGDARVAAEMSARLLDHGVYAIAFAYPVVPIGRARIRLQVSAAHTREDLTATVDALKRVRADVSAA